VGENCLINGSHLIRHLSFSTGAQDASGTLDSVHACATPHCHPVVSQKNYTVELRLFHRWWSHENEKGSECTYRKAKTFRLLKWHSSEHCYHLL